MRDEYIVRRFEGKTALVTGGSGGIGSAVVLRLLKEGASVLAVDINDEGLKKLQVKTEEAFPGKCSTAICDVTKQQDVKKAVAKGWKLFGSIDALINVAGGSLPGCPTKLLELTEERWDMIFNLNAKSTLFFCQEFFRSHLEHGTSGSVVNFASMAGISPHAQDRPHYAASKGAIIVLSKHMSSEFADRGFRVNVVAPGYCMSGDRIRELWRIRKEQGVDKKMLEEIPMRRVSEPDEVAAVVAFLASDDASYVTGEVIKISGGR